MKRDDFLFEYLGEQEKPFTWLDVGADTGHVSREIADRFGGSYWCIDIRERPDKNVYLFDGKGLYFPDNAFDFVLFNFVLHHAAEFAEGLLLDAVRVARKAVLIQEDIDDGTPEVRGRLKDHDPNAIYYSESGWKELFEEHSMSLQEYKEFPTIDLEEELYGRYKVPRAFIVLKAV